MFIKDMPELEYQLQREVFSVAPDNTVQDAINLLAKYGIGALPVLDGTALIGVFSERDVIRRVLGPKLNLDRAKISDVMTKNPDSVSWDVSVEKVIDMMELNQYRHMPVTNDEGVMIAFLSQRDFMNYLWMTTLRLRAGLPRDETV